MIEMKILLVLFHILCIPLAFSVKLNNILSSINKIKIDNIIPLDITNIEKIQQIDISINKIINPIDNISKRSIKEFKSKNIIPNNYEVLKVDKNIINENKNVNIDVKSESIPFGLEIIGGIIKSLLLDSLLPLEIIFTAESIFLGIVVIIIISLS